MDAKTFWRNFKDKIYGNEELKKDWNNTKNIGEFMIIIGNCKLKSSDEEGKCVYRPYVYDKENEGFVVPEWANES